jgi:hypothetical protein
MCAKVRAPIEGTGRDWQTNQQQVRTTIINWTTKIEKLAEKKKLPARREPAEMMVPRLPVQDASWLPGHEPCAADRT